MKNECCTKNSLLTTRHSTHGSYEVKIASLITASMVFLTVLKIIGNVLTVNMQKND